MQLDLFLKLAKLAGRLACLLGFHKLGHPQGGWFYSNIKFCRRCGRYV